MAAKVAYFCSLKFSPGLLKEIEQLATKMALHGWQTKLALSSAYSSLSGRKPIDIHYLTSSYSAKSILWDCFSYPYAIRPILSSLFAECSPDFLCIYNPHPLNGFVAALAHKANPSCTCAVYLHEPYVPDKSSYGFTKTQLIRLVEFQQAHMMRHLSCVLVPSEHSLSLYQSYYPVHKAVHVAPILLDDRRSGELKREYYSFVGTVNASRSLDDFIQLINLAASMDALDLKFRIVTRSAIAAYIKRLHPGALSRVEIVNKPIITDAEIGETMAKSKAIFLSHRQAAQSGNVPFAFMHGTPIICRDIPGLTQHVHHMRNGYVLPFDFSVQQLYQAVQFIDEHSDILGRQARSDYEQIFDIRNWERYYSWLL